MELTMTKDPRGFLKPASEWDAEMLKRVHADELCRVTVKMPRNERLHRKFMALWRFVWKNQDRYRTFESMLDVVKIKLGHADTVIDGHGVVHYKLKSFSFENCDEGTFRGLYERSIDIALDEFLPLWSRGDIEMAQREILSFA